MRHYPFVGAAVLAAVIAASGCGQKEQPAATETPAARAVNAAAQQSSAGSPESCVGLGCDGQVSVGLNEACVGMGCPSDAK